MTCSPLFHTESCTGSKFWLNVLTELKNRGLNDILITCVDSLKGFPDAINTVYPEASIHYASCIWCATACASCHGRTTKPSLAT